MCNSTRHGNSCESTSQTPTANIFTTILNTNKRHSNIRSSHFVKQHPIRMPHPSPVHIPPRRQVYWNSMSCLVTSRPRFIHPLHHDRHRQDHCLRLPSKISCPSSIVHPNVAECIRMSVSQACC